MATLRALHLLDRIAMLLRSELRKSAADDGLEPVHIMALWYLSQANRFSDNPLAVGEYLGLSKGNMSQRLNVLERKGLIRKTADSEDGRRVHLELTRHGAAVLRRCYPPAVWPAAGGANTGPGEALEASLDLTLRQIVTENGGRTFGQCRTCRFHQQKAGKPYCGLLQLTLGAAQVTRICREHQPAA